MYRYQILLLLALAAGGAAAHNIAYPPPPPAPIVKPVGDDLVVTSVQIPKGDEEKAITTFIGLYTDPKRPREGNHRCGAWHVNFGSPWTCLTRADGGGSRCVRLKEKTVDVLAPPGTPYATTVADANSAFSSTCTKEGN